MRDIQQHLLILILYFFLSGCSIRNIEKELECSNIDTIKKEIKATFNAERISMHRIEIKEEIYFPTLHFIEVVIVAPTFKAIDIKKLNADRMNDYAAIENKIKSELIESYSKIISACTSNNIEKIAFDIKKEADAEVGIFRIEYDVK